MRYTLITTGTNNWGSPIEAFGCSVVVAVNTLEFQDRLDTILEIRLSGVAKRLIWEIPDE